MMQARGGGLQLDLTRDLCASCGEPIEQAVTGRRRRTCSGRCRQRVSRKARRAARPAGFRDTPRSSPAPARAPGPERHETAAVDDELLDTRWEVRGHGRRTEGARGTVDMVSRSHRQARLAVDAPGLAHDYPPDSYQDTVWVPIAALRPIPA